MYRVLASSNRAVAQRVVRSTWNFTRGMSSKDPESGSVAGSPDAFGKKEKAEETRWARRFEAEQAAKYKAGKGKGASTADQQGKSNQGSKNDSQQRLAELEAEKRRIQQEIDQLKRQ